MSETYKKKVYLQNKILIS